jgi:hypothetical protein
MEFDYLMLPYMIQSTVANEISLIGQDDIPTGLVKWKCKPLVTSISH